MPGVGSGWAVDRLPNAALQRHKYGFNGDVGTAWETVWTAGGLYPWSAWPDRWDDATGVAVTLESAASGDAGAVYEYEGIGLGGALETGQVTLDGADATTPVSFPANLNRLMRVRRVSPNGAAGDVTAKVGATTVALLDPDIGSTQLAIYTVPNGYELLLQELTASVDRNNDARAHILRRPVGQSFASFSGAMPVSGRIERCFVPKGAGWRDAASFVAGTDLEMRAQKISGGGANVSADFSLIMIPT